MKIKVGDVVRLRCGYEHSAIGFVSIETKTGGFFMCCVLYCDCFSDCFCGRQDPIRLFEERNVIEKL